MGLRRMTPHLKSWHFGNQSMEQEIVSAKHLNCMVLIQCDANAKLGREIITQDPHKISENGRVLKDLIYRENLSLLNTSNLCHGAITRNRLAKENHEKSIIDYILSCENLSNFLELMLMDESRNLTLNLIFREHVPFKPITWT